MLPFIGPIVSALGGWGSTIAAGTAIASGIEQHSANQAAQEMANRNIKFQREMAETAIQKRVKDLMAAGLNPMLAYGGAAMASGGTSIPELKAPAATAANVRQNAMAAENAMADINLKNASADAAKADAEKKRWEMGERGTAEIGVMMANINEINSRADLNAQQKQNLITTLKVIEQEAKLKFAQTMLTGVEAGKAELEKGNIQADTRLKNLDATQKEAIMPSMIRIMIAQEKMTEASVPGAELKREAMTVWWRKLLAQLGFTIGEQNYMVEQAAGAVATKGALK